MLSNAPYRFYKKYWIRKKDGRLRSIRQPRRDLKAIQAWIKKYILESRKLSRHATAYSKGCSVKNNAQPHRYNRYFLCVDLMDFFHSVTEGSVAGIFRKLGYSLKTAGLLASFCCCFGVLPQGGVTSPVLSNLACEMLDRRIAGYCSRHDIVYTRYADDLTLSSRDRDKVLRAKLILAKIVSSEGFRINEKKTRIAGPNRRCEVTGLVKSNSGVSFGVGRKKKRTMRAILHNMLVKGGTDARYDSWEAIRGWMSYLRHIEPETYRAMREYAQALKGSTRGSAASKPHDGI